MLVGKTRQLLSKQNNVDGLVVMIGEEEIKVRHSSKVHKFMESELGGMCGRQISSWPPGFILVPLTQMTLSESLHSVFGHLLQMNRFLGKLSICSPFPRSHQVLFWSMAEVLGSRIVIFIGTIFLICLEIGDCPNF